MAARRVGALVCLYFCCFVGIRQFVDLRGDEGDAEGMGRDGRLGGSFFVGAELLRKEDVVPEEGDYYDLSYQGSARSSEEALSEGGSVDAGTSTAADAGGRTGISDSFEGSSALQRERIITTGGMGIADDLTPLGPTIQKVDEDMDILAPAASVAAIAKERAAKKAADDAVGGWATPFGATAPGAR